MQHKASPTYTFFGLGSSQLEGATARDDFGNGGSPLPYFIPADESAQVKLL